MRNPGACSLAAKPFKGSEYSAVEDLRARIQQLFSQAAERPFVVPNSKYGPGFVDASALQQNLWRAMYFPISWPVLADSLAEMEKGNATRMYETWAAMGKFSPPVPHFFGHHLREQPSMQYLEFPIIGCLDSKPTGRRLASRDAKIDFARQMQRTSFSGDIWTA